MLSSDDPAYFGREQSLVKHTILQKYLERFAHIVGHRWNTITYVDGFSGPWNVQSDDLHDSSFAIALEQLRIARDTIKRAAGRDLEIRCLFLETESEPFQKLDAFAKAQADVEVKALNASFENSVPAICGFIQARPQSNFPFIFIDPTGWTGFSMDLITPLLRLQPCEVLINFMTGHILRFAEAQDEATKASFGRLFGEGTFRDGLETMSGRERVDAIVFRYRDRIAEVGGFPHVPVTVVPHPEKDRSHFHLVYATRDLKGVCVFKESERKALEVTKELRADAKRRKRERVSDQGELFGGNLLPETRYTDELHSHYSAIARREVLALLGEKKRLPYDELFGLALSFPLVTQDDLRDWLAGIARIEGLKERERVPKPECDHYVEMLCTRENSHQS